MGYILVKTARDADQYVIWSTYTECPIWVGDRAELLTTLLANPNLGEQPPEPRIVRADETGSSAMFPERGGPFLGWSDEGPIFMQRGFLARHHLAECAERMFDDRDVTDLLTPLDEHDEVRPAVGEASR